MLNQPVLLYDEDCAFCRRWIQRLRRWNRQDRIRCVPATERHQIPGIPALSDEALARAMHLVVPDGRVFAGGEAFTALLPFLPGGRWLRAIMAFPGMQAVTNRAYTWVARHRHRFGRGPAHCDPR